MLNEAQQSLVNTLSLPNAESRIEAQALLRFVLGNVSPAWLLARGNDALQANIHEGFEALIKRRLVGEPIAYILGRREFYGLELRVTPDTLIPRPDTETLVEAALAKIADPSFPRRRASNVKEKKMDSRLCGNDDEEVPTKIAVLDLGTGSGAIAIAIAKQQPQAEVFAVDQSAKALAVAARNAALLGISNVRFLQSDWFSALADATFDVIVSNPPYIAKDDPHLSQGDLRFEPINALIAGEDGLDCIRQIIDQAEQHLNPHGWLMFEHGHAQAEKVAQLLKSAHFDSVTSIADLSGILRVTLGQRIQLEKYPC